MGNKNNQKKLQLLAEKSDYDIKFYLDLSKHSYDTLNKNPPLIKFIYLNQEFLKNELLKTLSTRFMFFNIK